MSTWDTTPNPSVLRGATEAARPRRLRKIEARPPVYHEAYPYRTGLPFGDTLSLPAAQFYFTSNFVVTNLTNRKILAVSVPLVFAAEIAGLVLVLPPVNFPMESALTAPGPATPQLIHAAFTVNFSFNLRLRGSGLTDSALAFAPAKTHPVITLSNHNLTAAGSGDGSVNISAFCAPALTGKVYYEMVCDRIGTNQPDYPFIGLGSGDFDTYLGGDAAGLGKQLSENAADYSAFPHGTGYTGTSPAFLNGDVMGWAVDMTAGKVWLSHNGLWFNGQNPATGENPYFTGLTGPLSPGITVAGLNQCQVTLRAGTWDWDYPAPAGFSHL